MSFLDKFRGVKAPSTPQEQFHNMVQKQADTFANNIKQLSPKNLTNDEYKFMLNTLTNGLGEALGMPFGGGVGWPGSPYSAPVNQTNPTFYNQRWYLISNFRQLLSEMFVECGLLQNVVMVPVDDALRGGITIKSKQLDEDEIKDLQAHMDRENDLNKMGEAEYWNRNFGGAGVIAVTDQDPEMPLDAMKLKDQDLTFRAVDMWELFWSEQNTQGYDPQVQDYEGFTHYNYYDIKLHRSRVLRLKGLTAPSFIRPRLRGWGFSVAEALVSSINQYYKGINVTYETLDEFKVDVYLIKNLMNMVFSPQGTQQIQQRIMQTNWMKNYQNAIVLDSEDQYEQKQLQFTGLADTMQGIRMQVAADMRIPMVKLFGTPTTGIGANDEDTLEVYNCMVESIRNKMKYHIIEMVELRSAQMYGMIPDDLEIEFKPLRQLNATDEEVVKNSKMTRYLAAKTAGEISTFEFRDACNKDGLFPMRLDTNGDELNPDDPEIEEIVTEGTSNPELEIAEGDDEANAEDSRAPTAEGKKKPESASKKNSIAWKKASYEASGGDSQYDDRRAPFFEGKPVGVDWKLWQECMGEAKKIPGVKPWKFALWRYKQMRGPGSF